MVIRYARMRLIPIAILLAASVVVLTAQRPASVDPYDEMAARLQAGPEYQSARTGRITLPTSDRGVSLDNVLEVPADYDPARRWPLRVSLHGGVGRAAPGPGDPPARPLTNRTQSAGELVLHPRAWSGSEWQPLVLANPDSGAEGQFFASNLANCPLHVVNGGKDPLYPAASVSPLIAMFRRGGIAVDFQVYPEAGHDVSWWPDERAKFEAFLAAHRRVAHPERISWETERTDRYNRVRWLVIDRLGQRASDRPLPDVNRFAVENGRELSLFSRSRQSGRVDITRKGNTFEAETRGVAAFTLLLSPDVVDFSSPVRVVVNGRTVHDSRVEKSARTLMAWAARDNDRTMLYGAELKITVP